MNGKSNHNNELYKQSFLNLLFSQLFRNNYNPNMLANKHNNCCYV